MIQNQELRLTLDAPHVLTLVRARLEERLSRPTEATVEVATTLDLDASALLEKDATLALEFDGVPVRSWPFLVSEVRFLGSKSGSLRYELALRPAMWFLRFTTDTRKYRSMSSVDIVAKLFAEKSVPAAWQLLRQPEERKFCVQYRETVLEFVARLMEFEGIYYAFDTDGTVRFADASPNAKPIDGVSTVELVETEGAMMWERPGLFEFSKGARVASGRATVSDCNWKKPKVPLLASAAAALDDELEVYDYPVGFRRDDQGRRLAQLRLEAQRVPARFVSGAGNVPTFGPGRRFEFAGTAASGFAGDYVLVAVAHEFENKKFESEGAEGLAYRNTFEAIPKAVPFRPPHVTAEPEIAGTHTATVRGPAGEEIHTDEHGRFRVQFHWDREAQGTDEDSRWLRQLQETASSMVLARVGWEQTVAYVNGDPDRPLGIARNINGGMPSEYAQPANKTRMSIKSPSYPSNGGFNELRLEDVAGAQHFDWKSEKDWTGDVRRNRLEHVGNNETHSVGAGMSHAVENDQSVDVGGNFETTVGGSYPFTVEGDRTKSVSGDESITIGSVRSATTHKNETEKVGGNLTITAGEEDGAGGVSRAASEDFERTVAGPWVVTGDGNIQMVVQQQMTEKVGGSKLVMASDGSIVGTVTGKLVSAVAGSVFRIAGESMGYSAKQSAIEVKGATMMRAGKTLAINGDHIQLEATVRLKLESGALAIELAPGQTTIRGKLKLEPTNQLVIGGSPNNITKG